MILEVFFRYLLSVFLDILWNCELVNICTTHRRQLDFQGLAGSGSACFVLPEAQRRVPVVRVITAGVKDETRLDQPADAGGWRMICYLHYCYYTCSTFIYVTRMSTYRYAL